MKTIQELVKEGEIALKPAVFIGLGGFGSDVIRAVKQRIRELLPDENYRQGFHYLALDTKPRSETDILSPEEYIPLSVGINPSELLRDPLIKEFRWFPKVARRWRPDWTIDAAQMVRAVGRFCLLVPTTWETLVKKLHALEYEAFQEYGGFEPPDTLKVYVISSLSGGTGSGIFLDVWFGVYNYLIKNHPTTSFQAFLALPEAWVQANSRQKYRFELNAYAALKELLHFVEGGEASHPHFEEVEISGALPKLIYIVSISNEEGTIVVDPTVSGPVGIKTLESKISQYLVASSILRTEQVDPTRAENVKVLDKHGYGGRRRAYSSVGSARFIVPAEIITEYFKLRILQEGLKRELLNEEKDIIENKAEKLLQESKLRAEKSSTLDPEIQNTLTDRIPKNVRSRLEMVDLVGFAEVNTNELIAEVEKAMKSKKEELENEIKSKIKISEILNKLERKIDKLAEEFFINDSLKAALDYLKLLRNKVIENQNSSKFKETYEEIVKDYNESVMKVEQDMEGVKGALSSIFWKRKRRVREELEDLNSSFQELLKNLLKKIILEQADQLYKDLIVKIGSIETRYIEVQRKLEEEIIPRIEMEIWDMENKLNTVARDIKDVVSIVDLQDVHELFNDLMSNFENDINSLRTAWKQKGLLNRSNMLDSDWLQKIQSFIPEKIIKNIKDMLKFDFLVNRFYRDERKRQQFFARNLRKAAPLFPLDKNMAQRDIDASPDHTQYESSVILAASKDLHSKVKDWLKEVLGEVDFVFAPLPTPYELHVYRITHGYTLHSIRKISSYEDQYEEYVRKALQSGTEEPIHAWPGAEYWENVIPPEEEEKQQLFIVAHALTYWMEKGQIQPIQTAGGTSVTRLLFQRGNYYYLGLQDKQRSFIRLGNGIEKALESFINHEEWVRWVDDMIHHLLKRDGERTIASFIQQYLPILDQEIKKATPKSQRRKILGQLEEQLKEFLATISS